MRDMRWAAGVLAVAIGGFGPWAGVTLADHGHGRDEVRGIIQDCERRTTGFVATLDRALDHSKLDGKKREDKLNEQARILERAMDQVRREFERHERYWDVKQDVARALTAARDINKAIERQQLARQAEDDWRAIRRELNRLADVYDLEPLR